MSPPTAEERLSQAELLLKKRISGTRFGGSLTLMRGEGIQPADTREYLPGDDVRQLDWNLTARTGVPHVKTFEAEHEMTVWVLLDLSPSMAWGTAGWTKEDLGLNLAAAVSVLTRQSQNRLGGGGMVDSSLVVVDPTTGPNSGRRLLHSLEVARTRSRSQHGRDSLRHSLERAGRALKRRGLVVVISDFLDIGFERPLGRLARRHDLIAVKITDPRESEITDIGTVVFEDTETGRQIEVDTSREEIRNVYAVYSAAQKVRVASSIQKTGADFVEISTASDWVGDLVEFLRKRKAIR